MRAHASALIFLLSVFGGRKRLGGSGVRHASQGAGKRRRFDSKLDENPHRLRRGEHESNAS